MDLHSQSAHNNDSAFQRNEMQINVPADHTIHKFKAFNDSCAIAIYSICYFVLRPCAYWNSTALTSIKDNGKQLSQKLNLDSFVTSDNLPNKIDVCGMEVTCVCNSTMKGELSDSSESKSMLIDIIRNNTDNSGFVMWFSSYCISCIFKPTKKSKHMYCMLVCDQSKTPSIYYIRNVNGTDSLVERIISVQKKSEDYIIQFYLCSCKNDRSEIKRLLKRQKNRSYYERMEPLKKKILLNIQAEPPKAKKERDKYRTMDRIKKQELLNKKAEQYRTMDSNKKQQLSNKNVEKYRTMHCDKKQQLLNKNAEKYRTMDSDKKQQLLNKNAAKYRTMDSDEKQQLSNKNAEKYRTMDSDKKQQLSNKNAEKYRTMDNDQRKDLLDKQIKSYYNNNSKDIYSCIDQFKKKIRQGPYFICCVCNRSLYKKSVMKLAINKYPSQHMFTIKFSFNGKLYVCKTCHSKCMQGSIPCQAVVNNLYVDDVPNDLKVLSKLEQILVAKRIVFEKIVIMPKGQKRKIKGAICNVPVKCDQTLTFCHAHLIDLVLSC